MTGNPDDLNEAYRGGGFLAMPTMRDIQDLQRQIDELREQLAQHRHGYRWELWKK